MKEKKNCWSNKMSLNFKKLIRCTFKHWFFLNVFGPYHSNNKRWLLHLLLLFNFQQHEIKELKIWLMSFELLTMLDISIRCCFVYGFFLDSLSNENKFIAFTCIIIHFNKTPVAFHLIKLKQTFAPTD